MKLMKPVEDLRTRRLTPEEELMVAVLEVSIMDFSGAKQMADRGDADAWFQRRDKGGLFCFETICEHFEIDADSIRHALLGKRQFGKLLLTSS